jgi:uncharacterized RDD family membrane protein YckC
MASDADESQSGLSHTAGRAAFFPARTAARVWREQLETAIDEVLSAPEIARVIDRALAGPLPEEITRSIVRHRVLERVVEELAATGELERLLAQALASPRTAELTDQVVASEAMQQAVREVAASPAVRDALTRQTTGFAEEVAERLRGSARRFDARLEAAVHRRPRTAAARPPFAGVATRAIALATDALLTIGLYMAIVGAVSLVDSLVGDLRPHRLVGVLLTVGWALIAGAYFVFFWSSAGQTPGMRLMRLRLRTSKGAVPKPRRSILRLIGLAVSIAVFFLGFVPILFDERRRGLADFLAGTVVVYDDVTS